jgi:hypothetical protein
VKTKSTRLTIATALGFPECAAADGAELEALKLGELSDPMTGVPDGAADEIFGEKPARNEASQLQSPLKQQKNRPLALHSMVASDWKADVMAGVILVWHWLAMQLVVNVRYR